MNVLEHNDEQRLRELATGIAKDVEDIDKLLERLGFTRTDYNELIETRTFKTILNQALAEWEGAANTHKRIKLKAAINIEEALPHFYTETINPKEALSSKVKAFEAIARVAGLGQTELTQGGTGQFFKLEINLGDNKPALVIDYDSESRGALPPAPSEASIEPERRHLSPLFAGITNDEL